MIYPSAWLLIALSAFNHVEAPGDDHIRWHFSSLKQSKFEWKLVFTADIDRGWHLYSQKLEPDGPMPTTFAFEKDNRLKLLGDVKEDGESRAEYDSTFMVNVVWYERKVVFTQKVRVRSKVQVHGKIGYQVCSEERCIPGSVMFQFDLHP